MPEKMKIAAIICELNPLHQGHQALFSHAKSRCQGLVCVLSGNYVQRGEPAILDKWARTRLALASGADLVLELPLPWAMAGAERFAAGGVALANGLGNVDTLFFGSEEGDAPRLRELAEVLLSPGFSRAIREEDTALPFAVRRQRAAARLVGADAAALLTKPNCILGVEYQKALLAQGSGIKAEAFPRRGAGHDVPEEQGPILSASQARELLAAEGRGRSAAEWGLRWLWNQPGVTCVLSGMNSLEMVRENCRIADLARPGEITEADFALIARLKEAIAQSQRVGCTGCGYCQPCPHGVDIPGVFRCWNEIGVDGAKRARREYLQTTAMRSPSTGAGQCVGCGKCEQHCPQAIPIRQALQEARHDLETPLYHLTAAAYRLLKI